MFEGVVRQVLLGYLGCYVKDIQKDQLKILVSNEEMLLENVELNLEAFDYLQLPFALKQGRVGKLSIKIPWKKLGPIIILLEDVFISASQRHDQETIDESILWELEQMEKECDIDDILSYRSVAECELQEVLSNASISNMGIDGVSISVECSLGMLAAGGTDDSSQFSGVVPDEVVKDIYEATKLHLLVSSTGDSDAKNFVKKSIKKTTSQPNKEQDRVDAALHFYPAPIVSSQILCTEPKKKSS